MPSFAECLGDPGRVDTVYYPHGGRCFPGRPERCGIPRAVGRATRCSTAGCLVLRPIPRYTIQFEGRAAENREAGVPVNHPAVGVVALIVFVNCS